MEARRRPATQEVWDQPPADSLASFAVIERGDKAEDREGQPFGFGRVLAEPKTDGWDDHMEALV